MGGINLRYKYEKFVDVKIGWDSFFSRIKCSFEQQKIIIFVIFNKFLFLLMSREKMPLVFE